MSANHLEKAFHCETGCNKPGKPEIISVSCVTLFIAHIIIVSYFFLRPGLLDLCEDWRKQNSTDLYNDVYDGQIWKDFLHYQNTTFLSDRNTVGLMMNIDWFQPFKHRQYSISVVYLVIMNLPRTVRYKRENILIVGLLPGPSEPSKTTLTLLP